MDLTKEAIEKIEALVDDANRVEFIDNKPWTDKQLRRVVFNPEPAAIVVTTLTGLVGYIQANIDAVTIKDCVIHIENYNKVTLLSKLSGENLVRFEYVSAKVDQQLNVFSFGNYLQIEAFVIALRSMFEPSKDTERLIEYMKKIRGGTAFELTDDGVSQSATTQSGISGALTKKETAPAIVKLRPYRTFRDIEQIESEFLFRMKLVDVEEKIVGCALFEADGGRWRNFAIKAIATFLKDNLPEGPAIIA